MQNYLGSNFPLPSPKRGTSFDDSNKNNKRYESIFLFRFGTQKGFPLKSGCDNIAF